MKKNLIFLFGCILGALVAGAVAWKLGVDHGKGLVPAPVAATGPGKVEPTQPQQAKDQEPPKVVPAATPAQGKATIHDLDRQVAEGVLWVMFAREAVDMANQLWKARPDDRSKVYLMATANWVRGAETKVQEVSNTKKELMVADQGKMNPAWAALDLKMSTLENELSQLQQKFKNSSYSEVAAPAKPKPAAKPPTPAPVEEEIPMINGVPIK